MTKPYTLLVILEAKFGKEHDLEAALAAVIAPSRAEESCLEYRLHRSIDNAAQFIFYENWKSKEHHQIHAEQSYITDLGAKLDSLLAKPVQIIFATELYS